MERIITYDEIPFSFGKKIYYKKTEEDPKLVSILTKKCYRLIDDIRFTDKNTIYLTGRREDYICESTKAYRYMVDCNIQRTLGERNITKPGTYAFNMDDLREHKYKLPFVFKNENQNGGREKFLIRTEEDYEKLIKACSELVSGMYYNPSRLITSVNYNDYFSTFVIQDYIDTPSKYNTSVRLLTTPSNNLLYGSLKYNKSEEYLDNTSLLGILLSVKYPLSTGSIVSNTLSGGDNILLGEDNYSLKEEMLLKEHGIETDKFRNVIESSKEVHNKFKSELGIICGFDYIYDREKDEWFLLEYHSKPMLKVYSKRQNIPYITDKQKMEARGRVKATALTLTLKRNN